MCTHLRPNNGGSVCICVCVWEKLTRRQGFLLIDSLQVNPTLHPCHYFFDFFLSSLPSYHIILYSLTLLIPWRERGGKKWCKIVPLGLTKAVNQEKGNQRSLKLKAEYKNFMNNFMIYIWSLLRKNQAAQAQLQGMCLNGGLVFLGASVGLYIITYFLMRFLSTSSVKKSLYTTAYREEYRPQGSIIFMAAMFLSI